jgi:hypothetical protein
MLRLDHTSTKLILHRDVGLSQLILCGVFTAPLILSALSAVDSDLSWHSVLLAIPGVVLSVLIVVGILRNQRFQFDRDAQQFSIHDRIGWMTILSRDYPLSSIQTVGLTEKEGRGDGTVFRLYVSLPDKTVNYYLAFRDLESATEAIREIQQFLATRSPDSLESS